MEKALQLAGAFMTAEKVDLKGKNIRPTEIAKKPESSKNPP